MTPAAKATREASAFKLDFRPPTRRHDISSTYVVTTLWLMGFSAKSIGSLIDLRRSQILGIVHRSGFESRSGMTDSQRQQHLNELRAIRFDDDGRPLDGGILDRLPWTVRPLTRARIRPARKKVVS